MADVITHKNYTHFYSKISPDIKESPVTMLLSCVLHFGTTVIKLQNNVTNTLSASSRVELDLRLSSVIRSLGRDFAASCGYLFLVILILIFMLTNRHRIPHIHYRTAERCPQHYTKPLHNKSTVKIT